MPVERQSVMCQVAAHAFDGDHRLVLLGSEG
jgi:hypothetical protein